MQKEIEVKARIKDIEFVVSALNRRGCQLSAPVEQYDQIFVPEEVKSIPVENGVNVLRIREQSGKYIFTLKQQITDEFNCFENELEIDDPDAMAEIIKTLGFYKISEVRKQRRTGYAADYEICVDVIEGLGDFIEVEKLTDKGEESLKVQAEMFKFLEGLGVSGNDRVYSGYDVLLSQTKG